MQKIHYIPHSTLAALFEKAFEESVAKACDNPRYVAPQAFVDSTHCKYCLELLLPLYVTLDEKVDPFQIRHCFALALRPSYEINECKEEKHNNKNENEINAAAVASSASTHSPRHAAGQASPRVPVRYTAMSILTSEMAYSNCRLVGCIDSKWIAELDIPAFDQKLNNHVSGISGINNTGNKD